MGSKNSASLEDSKVQHKKRTIIWRLALALLIAFIVALGYSTVYRAAWSKYERTDFTVYRAAGQAVIDGRDLYEAHNSRGWNYVYPPPFALLMVPFASISIAWGATLWYLISVVMIGAAIRMSVLLSANTLPTISQVSWFEWVVPSFLVLPYLLSGLARCQASEWMIWLVILAIFCNRNGRNVWGSASLAAAALIKAFPLALIPYFVWRGQWRFLQGFVIFLLIFGLIFPTIFLSWDRTVTYWHEWTSHVASPALAPNHEREGNPLYGQLLNTQKPRNQSLQSMLMELGVSSSSSAILDRGLAALMLGVMLILSWRAAPSVDALAISAFLAWNLLIPPISESHYFGLLILPLTVISRLAISANSHILRRTSYLTLAFFGVLVLLVTLDHSLRPYRLLGWATLIIWFYLVCVAAWIKLGESRPRKANNHRLEGGGFL